MLSKLIHVLLEAFFFQIAKSSTAPILILFSPSNKKLHLSKAYLNINLQSEFILHEFKESLRGLRQMKLVFFGRKLKDLNIVSIKNFSYN